MADFIEQEWSKYQARMKESAEYLAGDDQQLKSKFTGEAEKFVAGEVPGSYPELLKQISAGNDIVTRWQDESPRELSSSPGQNPYSDSSHHESSEAPTETMAEQTAEARETEIPNE